ncbi:hypothetical protein C8F01DRAFT_1214291 [Mycena amicta]|nr:hypothetical protein C8F01DRAFT_1214291 [Mycena amicta]
MYDPNFCFPLPAKIECDLVELVPFIPSEHANVFFDATRAHPELYTYLPWGPFSSRHDFVATLIEGRIQGDPGAILFAVLNKKAGVHPRRTLQPSLDSLSPLPDFQRTHVTRCAGALLLRLVLASPAEGGLGLRRAVWKANAANERSIRVAERMGFRQEGVIRWERTLPPGKEASGNGIVLRGEDPRPDCAGRDTVLLSACWDDYEDGGVKELLESLLHPDL